MRLSVVAGLLAAGIATCAVAQPPPGGPGGPPPGGPPSGGPPPGGVPGKPGGPGAGGPLTQLFVSPCGRPYRAGPKDPYPVVAWFNGADTNKDGKLDKTEMRADADLFFRALDQDRNGLIEGPEITFYERRILPEMMQNQVIGELKAADLVIRAQFGASPGSVMGNGGMAQGGTSEMPSNIDPKPPRDPYNGANMQGAAAYGLLREPEPVTASDADFNRRITPEEFAAASNRRFKLLDREGLGYLTLDKLPRTVAQINGEDDRKGRGGRGPRRPS